MACSLGSVKRETEDVGQKNDGELETVIVGKNCAERAENLILPE